MKQTFIRNLFLYLFLWTAISKGQTNQPQFNHKNVASECTDSSYFFYQRTEFPRDCQEIHEQCSTSISSNIYLIKPSGYPDAFEVYCDNNTDGGGWTVFLRRDEESIDFNRPWKEYKNGFGFLNNQFWLGLEKLSFLTNQKNYKFRIDMQDVTGSNFYIEYNLFAIGDEWSEFKLTVAGQYSGTADSVIVFCPPNMEYGNCTCQTSCEDPENVKGCQTTCSEGEACNCQKGLLKKGDDCVSPAECGCFIEGEGVLTDGHALVSSNCSSLCQCQSNVLTCDDSYRCSSDATCEERDGVRQCYCNDGFTGGGTNCEAILPTDCADIYNNNLTDSGVYTIKPTNWPGSPFEVYCNMSDEGGWTVFQRRMNGFENFYREWNSYKDGFGSVNHELWLGNDKIFYMTNQKNYQLRIDLADRNGSSYFAKYNLFRIRDESDNYRLVSIGTYTGNTGYNAMGRHTNQPFSTYDRDNDGWIEYNCAERHQGGWWYGFHNYYRSYCSTSETYCDWWRDGNSCGKCAESNLNGDYSTLTPGTTIHWDDLSGYDCNIMYTEMKIKPV